MTYESLFNTLEDDKLCEKKYIIEDNHKTMPLTFQPVDIINNWIPFIITIQGI